ncbi:ABC transporter substrate-binding protein [uncultured Aquincola sp.]|uniref:heme/hemin ABC transporter substrate-binding protein n=1 Tax=uncultured Aquincola sp. TaxID=886556 RepID=UPI0032B0FEDB
MKRRQLLAAGVGAGAGLAWPAQAQPAPRLVSVGGALTEIVYRLGAAAQLVGTDTTSLYPEAAQRTPKVGYQRQLSAEGVLSLRPDVLLTTDEAGPPAVIEQLRGAGVRVVSTTTSHDLAEVQRKITAAGQATGRSAEAAALQQQLLADWQRSRQALPRLAGPAPRVLFVLAHGNAPQVAGAGTAAQAMLQLAGARNALQGFDGYRAMTAEAVVAAAPDLVLSTQQAVQAAGGPAAFWQLPGLAMTPAFAARRLHAPDALWLLGFGPRLPQAVAELAQVVAAIPAARA